MALQEPSFKHLSQTASTITDDQFQQLVQLAIEYLKSRKMCKNVYLNLKNGSNLSSRDHDLMTSQIISFVRKSMKADSARNDFQVVQMKLVDDLKLSSAKKEFLIQSLFEKEARFQLMKEVENVVPSPPFVLKVDWRLDVIIGSSDAGEEMKPVIVFKFTTNKGILCCECSLSVFHQLRVAVATSLKELYFLNSKVN